MCHQNAICINEIPSLFIGGYCGKKKQTPKDAVKFEFIWSLVELFYREIIASTMTATVARRGKNRMIMCTNKVRKFQIGTNG